MESDDRLLLLVQRSIESLVGSYLSKGNVPATRIASRALGLVEALQLIEGLALSPEPARPA